MPEKPSGQTGRWKKGLDKKKDPLPKDYLTRAQYEKGRDRITFTTSLKTKNYRELVLLTARRGEFIKDRMDILIERWIRRERKRINRNPTPRLE